MKLTLSVAIFCALLLNAMSYPHPEPDSYQPDDPIEVHEAPIQRYRRQAPNFQPPKLPQPQPPQQRLPQGNIGGNIDYRRGSGLVGTVNGEATLWRSRNGMSDLGANGHYSRGLSGPGRGQQSYGGNVVFTHRF